MGRLSDRSAAVTGARTYFFLLSFFASLSFLGFLVSFFWLLLPFATMSS